MSASVRLQVAALHQAFEGIQHCLLLQPHGLAAPEQVPGSIPSFFSLGCWPAQQPSQQGECFSAPFLARIACWADVAASGQIHPGNGCEGRHGDDPEILNLAHHQINGRQLLASIPMVLELFMGLFPSGGSGEHRSDARHGQAFGDALPALTPGWVRQQQPGL